MRTGKEKSTVATRYSRSYASSCGVVDSSMFKSEFITGNTKRRIDATTSAVTRRRTYRSGGGAGPESRIGRHPNSDLPLVDLVRNRADAAGVRPRELGRQDPPATGESKPSIRQNAQRRHASHV